MGGEGCGREAVKGLVHADGLILLRILYIQSSTDNRRINMYTFAQ